MNTDIVNLKRMLADRAPAVAEYLLPKGRKEGNEWRAGSTSGEPGQSLGVHLSGQKAGTWCDFGGDATERGDLVDLWCQARRMSLAEALDDIRRWLGVSRPEPYRDPRPAYTRPKKPECQRPNGRVRDYLIEARNIPEAILNRYRIGERGDEIVFPFLLPAGGLAMAKVRKAEDGAKPMPTAANCEPILFGWQAMPDDAREVVITEGEIDALAAAAYGLNGMSVPFGGGGGKKQQWIENEFDRLDRFERIYVATDMDEPGEAAAREIVSRLGRHRCYRLALPRKDFDECLMDGVSPEEIRRAVETAASLDPDGLKAPSSYGDNVVHLFWPANGYEPGFATPYGKLGPKLLFRPAEVTLWSGASGAGKSQILSDCIVHWIAQGSRACLASLEMKPAQTLKRMCKQAGGVDHPTEPYIREILSWLDRGLLLYDHVGKAGITGLLDVFNYARAKYGCDQFIIDSLMRLGIAGDDYTGQEKAVYQLVEWAIENNVHLHLVAHARKGAPGTGAPETEDIKGAMEIGANAFNILTVWRNRKLEEDTRSAETDAERRTLEDKPGVILNVAKQRNGDFEGKIGLWFDQATYRYASSAERSGIGRTRYVRQQAEQAA